ncbi:asc-type amino acid transporter 1 isoform X4 [Heterocephalus glaber]|uniref:Asc-type amino acid transporter 1 isoform X4 n=1 Tax=Heterocephalus glaber TaxID=10181 RepID=A0AAX6RIP4_HETGA|nr:asc-type amino acid transporter 1 isoform X4 [Heterocephalus glaber]
MGASPLRAVGEGRRPGLLPPPRPSLPGGRGPGPGASACARFGRCPDCVRGDRTDRLTDGRSRGRRDRRGSAGSGGTAGRQDDDGPLPAAERVQEPWPCSLAFPRPGPGPRRLGEGGAQERDRTRERLHHHHRFLLLWSAVLIMYPTSLAVISMTFSNYVLQPVFPNCIPPATASRALSMACLSGLPSLVLLTWVNSSSVRWATRIQDIFTGGKLLALSIIIGVGFVQIFQGHFEELRPSNAFAFWMTPSVGHLALAFLQGSFAFSGWNFLNYVTEELVDPRKNLPRAIFISIPLVTFVYTFTNVAYFTAMSPQELLASNAVAVTFGEKLLGYFSWVMPVSVALSTFGGINGYLFTSSRLCFSGAREGHLPSLLAMIHVRHCTPIPALLVCCGATAVIMLVGDTYTLINYVSFINYLCYGVTILGLLVLRWRRPALHRSIKVNLLIPVAYLVFWAFLLVFSFISEPMVCGVGIIIILTGVPIFFLGVFWRSKPKCVHRLTESMTRWGQKLCFVVYPQGSPEEEENGPCQPSPLPDMDKPLKSQ